MKTTREHISNGDRYKFDFDLCHFKKGWAQLDTNEDAWYYGNWINPIQRKICSYAEGDVTVTECETDEEFVAQVREAIDWYTKCGREPMIDGMCEPAIIDAFTAFGLGELLH